MLILGEPGSGKTGTLFELARELIGRFGKDPSPAWRCGGANEFARRDHAAQSVRGASRGR